VGVLPDKDGKLSLDERTQASDKINETAQHEGDPCPHCGNIDTSVAEDLFQLPVANGPITTSFIPVLPVVCNNCGYLRLFNSRAFGLEVYAAVPNEGEG